MKVLLVTSEEYSKTYNEFYVGLHKRLGSMDTRRLKAEQRNLRSYFAHHIDLKKYDRIFIHLAFSAIKTQMRFLKQLDNVVFYDTSAYNGDSINAGGVDAHLKLYQKIPWARIIVSNYHAMTVFQREGLDAWCVPKGFNSQYYRDKKLKRNVPIMLIKNEDEKASEAFLALEERLGRRYPNLQTEDNFVKSGASQLNRTGVVICADLHREEYSRKIFRAMACGCLVVSFNQGDEENFYLSLKDMENIVLFDDVEVLFEKLATLTKHPTLMKSIIQNGRDLALENHNDLRLGAKAADYVAAGMRDRKDYRIGLSAFGWRF